MGRAERMHRGGCLCGAVRFEARGAPSWVAICHCATCRRATGGALMAAAGFSRSRVRFAGRPRAVFASSPGVRRSFCDRCGTALCYESERWPEDIHLMVGAFDEPEAMTPAFHIHTGECLPWLRLADALVRYKTTPSAGDVMDRPAGPADKSVRRYKAPKNLLS